MRRSSGMAAALAALAWAGGAAQHAAAEQGLDLVEAARTTLVRQPRVRLQEQQLEISRADLRTARGQFDLKLVNGFTRVRSDTPNTLSDQQFRSLGPSTATDLTTYELGFQRQFRSGLTLAPSADVTRTEVSASPDILNRSNVSIAAVQPLLRGRGASSVAANERFSEIDLAATELDLRQTRSASVLRTVTAYWNYLSAVKRLQIALESQGRAQRILEETRTLIDLGARPAADVKQAEANLADRMSATNAAELSLYQAKQDLGLSMGLEFAEIEALPLPAQDFPAVPPEATALPHAVLVDWALGRRWDLISSRRREEQSDVLVKAAHSGIKPQLDLVATAGYAGLAEGPPFGRYLGAFGRNIPGTNATLGVTFSWPWGNNAAMGRYLRNRTAFEQAQVRTADLFRTIQSNVAVAREDLARSAERVRTSSRASELYRSAVDDEREKHKLGSSTVIDLINTEDRLTRTQQDEVAARASYANAVARLRFETGTLLTNEDGVTFESLTTMPRAGQ